MIKMTAKARKAAKSLAVELDAYQTAIADWDRAHSAAHANAVDVWGGMLRDTQENIGIQIVRPEHIAARIQKVRDWVEAQALAA